MASKSDDDGEDYDIVNISMDGSAVAHVFSANAPIPTDDVSCDLCHELVVDAVQLTCCGALGCRDCVNALVTNVESCPFCFSSAKTMQIVVDKRAERKSMFPRRCSFWKEGCEFVGIRAEMNEHKRHCQCIPKQRLIGMLKMAEHDVEQLKEEIEKLNANETALTFSSTSDKAPPSTRALLTSSGASSVSCGTRELRDPLGFDYATGFWHPLQGTHLSVPCEDPQQSKEWEFTLPPYNHILIITLETETSSVHVTIEKGSDSLPPTSGIVVSFFHPETLALVVRCYFTAESMGKMKEGENIGFKSALSAAEFASLVKDNQFHVLFDQGETK